MAHEYIAGGPKAGNEAMKVFDSTADEMGDKVEALVKQMDDEASASAQTAVEKNSSAGRWGLVLSLLVILLTLSCAFILSGLIGRPIAEMSKLAAEIARGNIEQTLAHHSNDEIGTLADALRSLIAYIKRVAADVDSLSKGDF